ncbi:MAG: 3-isopropylmalate dehydratase large subunit [Bacteroidales bacterium]|jgi:3-isopropylmalate dehydratase small subunit|nr:3-isopropylmalate dehydratase large subunit [Bacteroidales bacterium]
MNIIEKIIRQHSSTKPVSSGDIVNISIDCRAARDFGGANVVKHLLKNGLKVDDPQKTCFTFDCNPGGSDQKYAANQHFCRQYARENNITVYDIDTGIGTHHAIELGLASPGSTFLSTDSHANIMGAIGAFGQGMGDQDIAAAWAYGEVWFKVPESIRINFEGNLPRNISAKDFALNLLNIFGANKLLACSVELYGSCVDTFTLDQRITIASMATEMGAIILLFPPNEAVLDELEQLTKKRYLPLSADKDAQYKEIINIDVSKFQSMLALPGHPHDNVAVESVKGIKIDSAFIGSCTNGRMEDLRIAASILKNKKVAKGVVLKIVPSTDRIWKQALNEGLIHIFKEAGALVSNAGCAGCAAGQVGQNGPEEITISTGNRNFAGKQGKGLVYLASPEIVASSAIAGYITTADDIKEIKNEFEKTDKFNKFTPVVKEKQQRETTLEGKVWLIDRDNIDTDMIFHNRYLTITDINEMGQYAFDNLEGYEDFAQKAKKGDILVVGKNFGAGSSRQQAVDCFIALGISCILAESYGAIYERNAINAGFPVLAYTPEIITELQLKEGDFIRVNFITGEIINTAKKKTARIRPFFDAQTQIFHKGGLLG